jgi:hypothetical protein
MSMNVIPLPDAVTVMVSGPPTMFGVTQMACDTRNADPPNQFTSVQVLPWLSEMLLTDEVVLPVVATAVATT